MSQEPTSSGVSTQEAISWSFDDPYAKAMGKPECLGRVRGVGFGALPARSSHNSLRLSTLASQDPVLLQGLVN
ncbi:hypothetical protein SLA2020_278770 [Shorea laevis]